MSNVASTEELEKLLAMIPAPILKEAILSKIQTEGLCFEADRFFRTISDAESVREWMHNIVGSHISAELNKDLEWALQRVRQTIGQLSDIPCEDYGVLLESIREDNLIEVLRLVLASGPWTISLNRRRE